MYRVQAGFRLRVFEKNYKPRTDPQVSNASDLVCKSAGPWVKQ
jgi:hypothetical protein